MPFIIRLDKTAAGVETDFDGRYVAQYDPTYVLPDGSYDGGILEVTWDRKQALRFPTFEAAYQKYQQSARLRPTGEPDRPLTAWSASFEEVTDAETALDAPAQAISPEEHVANEAAKTLRRFAEELERARVITQALLRAVGTPGSCKGCDAQIYWVRHANGKASPYDPDGLTHFATCPKRAEFKKRGRAQNAR